MRRFLARPKRCVSDFVSLDTAFVLADCAAYGFFATIISKPAEKGNFLTVFDYFCSYNQKICSNV